ncbi:hypothetical protein CRUP_030793 [Coryphaenoides rupestris]|nr:hypothetical protein CRUP_030793 [Coryphaenoides rupestris]
MRPRPAPGRRLQGHNGARMGSDSRPTALTKQAVTSGSVSRAGKRPVQNFVLEVVGHLDSVVHLAEVLRVASLPGHLLVHLVVGVVHGPPLGVGCPQAEAAMCEHLRRQQAGTVGEGDLPGSNTGGWSESSANPAAR